jgi:hypothetical protein
MQLRMPAPNPGIYEFVDDDADGPMKGRMIAA